MEQAKSSLAAAATAYMEQLCLLCEVQETVDHLRYASRDLAFDQDVAEADDIQQGKREDAASYAAVASLAKHLGAAALIQQLQLPAAAAQTAFRMQHEDDVSSSDAQGAHEGLVGSKQHIMGVTQQDIRQLFLPSRKAAQRAHAALLPLLEQNLKQHAQAAAAAITGADTGGTDVAGQAVHKAAAMREAVVALQQSHTQQLQQLQQEAAGYLQELDSIHAVLQQLVGTCMLQEQPKLEQVSRGYLEANVQQITSKLHSMQALLWESTYDSKNVQALSVISREQQTMEQQLRSSIEQAQAELQEYTQLGPEFESIAQEYGANKAAIREVDQLFEKFTELENEAATYY